MIRTQNTTTISNNRNNFFSVEYRFLFFKKAASTTIVLASIVHISLRIVMRLCQNNDFSGQQRTEDEHILHSGLCPDSGGHQGHSCRDKVHPSEQEHDQLY
jgi:hypothetical protein